jgi:DNA-binding MarR family transcriptional regulator
MTNIMQATHAASSADALRTAGTLILLARALDRDLRQLGPDDALTLQELSVLGYVHRGHDLPSTLARSLRLDPGRVTRITDRLAVLGFLDRAGDSTDRRRCLLSLTPSGVDRLARAREDMAGIMTELLDGLTDEERRALTLGLEGARRLVEPED